MRPRKPSPATIIASLALFFALGGTAIAVRHYLITSTSQIKPSVLKALRGKIGPPGKTGATGPAGAAASVGLQGANGPQGLPGVSGTGSVVARIRSVAPLTTTSTEPEHPSFVNDPLTGASWVQGAQELDQRIGLVEIGYPPLGTCTAKEGSVEFIGALIVVFRLNGAVVGKASYSREYVGYKGAGQERFLSVGWGSGMAAGEKASFGDLKEGPYWEYLSEPGSDTSHTLTAEVADGCGYGGGTASEHFTVKAIRIDVLGAR